MRATVVHELGEQLLPVLGPPRANNILSVDADEAGGVDRAAALWSGRVLRLFAQQTDKTGIPSQVTRNA